jgi:hypothetical protein
MAHIYMSFDFGSDEDKAQLARHKLEMWKQAFRLDKKLLYKFERPAGGNVTADGEAKAEAAAAKAAAPKAEKKPAGKAAGKGKGKVRAEQPAKKTESAAAAGPVKLHVRLGFSGHEKMTEERLVKRIPGEEPFSDASPEVMRQGEPGFDETAAVFDALED